jgi:hypothetical protein
VQTGCGANVTKYLLEKQQAPSALSRRILLDGKERTTALSPQREEQRVFSRFFHQIKNQHDKLEVFQPEIDASFFDRPPSSDGPFPQCYAIPRANLTEINLRPPQVGRVCLVIVR